MDIKLFDKRYVYLEWSDELEGKDCILAKTYQDLKDFVNSGDEGRFCKVNKGKEKPFTNLWSECDFCYYDPNLKVKKAWLEGKTIQQDVLNVWEDYINLPRTSSYFYNINWDAYEWRIKPIENWYVVFAENDFIRVSFITDLVKSPSYFQGSYEECGKWIEDHKAYTEILSACREGKTIQYRQINGIWHPWTLNSLPTIETLEDYDWRIKHDEKIAECYFVNIYKSDNSSSIRITDHADTNNPIFWGTMKQCDYVVKKVNKFMLDNCLCRCRNTDCNKCDKLLNFVKNINFKTTRRMTNKELAEWLAKGNGEVKHNGIYNVTIDHFHNYFTSDENKEVDDNVSIREWGSDEWKEPLIEV